MYTEVVIVDRKGAEELESCATERKGTKGGILVGSSVSSHPLIQYDFILLIHTVI